MPLINVRNLFMGFGGPPLLEGADLQIEKGERIGLVGRNGEGKSTLLKIINNEIDPDQGEIDYHKGARTALLSQEIPQGLRGTMHDVVEGNDVSLDHESEEEWQRNKRVDRVLSLLKLDPAPEFECLSAGMKRRVLLARCMAREPEILLLDEPTNHLDMASIEWLEEFLLRFEGSLLFVTHDPSLSARSERVLHLLDGRLHRDESNGRGNRERDLA